ncbi:MAG: hypothetical protein ACOYN2_03285 [Patescibacteria group bacterium]
MVADGKENSKYDYTQNFSWSPDGKRFSFVAQKGGKEYVVIDGKESKAYPIGSSDTMKYSQDGKSSAYFRFVGGIGTVVKDGKEMVGTHSYLYLPDGSFVYVSNE